MKQAMSWMRLLAGRLLVIERRFVQRLRASAMLRRVAHADLLSFGRGAMARGTAIGMFWTCMPMPFQMAPAALFCWLGFGNLPIALLCVWLSNPLTYLPFFYVEYKIGMTLFHGDEANAGLSLAEFAARYENVAELAGHVYWVVLEGALVLGVALAVVGYFAGAMMSFYLGRVSTAFARRRRARDD